jgi:hypothetical protein
MTDTLLLLILAVLFAMFMQGVTPNPAVGGIVLAIWLPLMILGVIGVALLWIMIGYCSILEKLSQRRQRRLTAKRAAL